MLNSAILKNKNLITVDYFIFLLFVSNGIVTMVSRQLREHFIKKKRFINKKRYFYIELGIFFCNYTLPRIFNWYRSAYRVIFQRSSNTTIFSPYIQRFNTKKIRVMIERKKNTWSLDRSFFRVKIRNSWKYFNEFNELTYNTTMIFEMLLKVYSQLGCNLQFIVWFK